MDAYELLAPVYDAWQAAGGRPFHEIVLGRIDPLLSRLGAGRALTLVDLGCGTGGLLHALRRRHPSWRLCGVDGSGAMLAAAHEVPGAESISFLRAAIDDTDRALPDAAFDVVGCFHDTLNHLPDEMALRHAIEGAARVLRPGGHFFFDVTNALGFERWWRGRDEAMLGDRRLVVEKSWNAKTRTATAHLLLERHGAKREATLVERCFEESTLRAALGAGHFDFAGEPWSPFDLDERGKTFYVARRA